jgi:D-alanine transaminase
MSRVAYVNGRYVPHGQAAVHIDDRGYQFADGVYEVTAVRNGKLVDNDWHMERLARSLRELRIDAPMSDEAISMVMAETARRNGVKNGIVYLQITRGVARRDHPFPTGDIAPAIVMTAKNTPAPKAEVIENGVKVVSVPDIRWARRDIKSISLLPNCLAKQAAKEIGAYEAWQVADDGHVTEGSSTNAWIVDRDGALITHPVEEQILNGITRRRLIELAKSKGIKVEERYFTIDEAKQAREAFLTSTTSFVTAIVEIDGSVIGNGKPGSLSRDLRELYMEFADAS